MKEQTVKITSKEGLHARPSTLLVQEAGKYTSEIHLEYNGKKVNLKSIMGLMSLGVAADSELNIIVDGEDEQEALQRLLDVVKNEGLGEY